MTHSWVECTVDAGTLAGLHGVDVSNVSAAVVTECFGGTAEGSAILCSECGAVSDGVESTRYELCDNGWDDYDYNSNEPYTDAYAETYAYCLIGCSWLDCGLDYKGDQLIICDVCHNETGSGIPGQIMTPAEAEAAGIGPLEHLHGIDMSNVSAEVVAECFAKEKDK